MIFVDPETDRSYNYTQVRKASLDFGKGLKAVWEWKKGDVLALFTPNCIDTPIITWGTLWYVILRSTWDLFAGKPGIESYPQREAV